MYLTIVSSVVELQRNEDHFILVMGTVAFVCRIGCVSVVGHLQTSAKKSLLPLRMVMI